LVEIPCQTVEVLSDEEEVQIMNENFKAEAFRVKIEEAKLTRSKNNILKVLYVEFNFPGTSIVTQNCPTRPKRRSSTL
jgi:hypothetical protein